MGFAADTVEVTAAGPYGTGGAVLPVTLSSQPSAHLYAGQAGGEICRRLPSQLPYYAELV